MALLYPRRQTLFIFIICLIAVGGAIYLNRGGADASSVAQNIQVSGGSEAIDAAPVTTAATTSVDPSGSIDWKKDFGSSTQSYAEATAKNPTASNKITLTDQFGSDFLQKYMQLEQSGLISDDGASSDAAASVVASNAASIQPKTYVIKDITLSPTDDAIAYDAWGKGIISALSEYRSTQNEAVIAQSAISSGDMSVLQSIDPIIAEYKKMISDIRTNPTPVTASAQTLNLVNSLSILLTSAESFRALDADPMRSVLAVQMFSEGVDAWTSALAGTKGLLNSKGLSFVFNPLVVDTVLAYQ